MYLCSYNESPITLISWAMDLSEIIDEVVPKTVDDYDKRSAHWKHRLDTFITTLDKKVTIDLRQEKYKIIYDELHIIVNDVIRRVRESDPRLADIKIRRTGSIKSGLKVGLPHETDYVIELPEVTCQQLHSVKYFDQEISGNCKHSITKTFCINSFSYRMVFSWLYNAYTLYLYAFGIQMRSIPIWCKSRSSSNVQGEYTKRMGCPA